MVEKLQVEFILDGLNLGVIAERVAQILQTNQSARTDREWPEWMSVETAATYLDISEERVRKLKDRHGIPYYQDGPGCRIFFYRSELDEWMSGFGRAACE